MQLKDHVLSKTSRHKNRKVVILKVNGFFNMKVTFYVFLCTLLMILLLCQSAKFSEKFVFKCSSTGPDLNKGKRMQAVKKDISSGQVCYAGRTLTWNEKGDKKKKAERKKSILSTIASSNGSSSGKGNEINGMPKGIKYCKMRFILLFLKIQINTVSFFEKLYKSRFISNLENLGNRPFLHKIRENLEFSGGFL